MVKNIIIVNIYIILKLVLYLKETIAVESVYISLVEKNTNILKSI